MAKTKQEPKADELEPEIVADVASGLYRDRAGPKIGGGPSEGQSYAGEIARQAQLSVEQAAEASE